MRQKRQRSIRLLMFIASTLCVISLMIFSFGCGKEKEKPVASFNIGFSEWVGFAPFFLAKEKGFFGDLQVETHFIGLESERREGLGSGKLQMICETMDMFQMDRENSDYPGQIVFGIDESSGRDGILVAENIKSLKDIKGKKVAAELNSSAYFIILTLLDKEEMTLKDIDFQKRGDKEAADAFAEGKVDVAGTHEPYLSSAIKKRGESRILISSDDLPRRIVNVAIVKYGVIKKRKKDLKKVYEGWYNAVDYISKNPEESMTIMAKAFKLKPEEFSHKISGLNYLGDSENKEFFGNQKSPGNAFEIFGDIGSMLIDNQLSKVKAHPGSKINLSIINPSE